MSTRVEGKHFSDRALPVAVGVLVAVDVIGGMLAVRAGVNTWSEAWGPAALLAAPVPMVVAQVLLTWLALRLPARWAALAAGLLALACLISVVSGFFDGGLANPKLSGWLVAWQVLLLGVTAAVGGIAAARTFRLLSTPPQPAESRVS
jgi:hypothetical protein